MQFDLDTESGGLYAWHRTRVSAPRSRVSIILQVLFRKFGYELIMSPAKGKALCWFFF